MITFIAINLIAIFALISYRVEGDIWHPSVFAGVLWVFILTVGQAAGFKDLSLTGAAYIFFFVGTFIIFSNLGSYLCNSSKILKSNKPSKRFKIFFLLTIIISIWTLYFYIKQALQYPSLGYYLFAVRDLSISGESILQDANFLQRKAPILIYGLVVFNAVIFAKKNENTLWDRIMFFLVLTLAALILMAEGARATFFILSGSVFIIFQSHRKITSLGAAIVIVALILFFSLITLLRVFGNDVSVNYLDVLMDTGSDLAFYCCSGPVAFDYVINNMNEFSTNFNLTLNSLQHLLYNVGILDVYQPSLTLGADQSLYVNVLSDGYRAGNVYTFIYPLLHDFSLMGGLAIMSLIGLSVGYLYKIKNGNWFECILYSTLMSALLFSSFNEYWISLLLSPGFIYVILIGILIFGRINILFYMQNKSIVRPAKLL